MTLLQMSSAPIQSPGIYLPSPLILSLPSVHCRRSRPDRHRRIPMSDRPELSPAAAAQARQGLLRDNRRVRLK